jgi:GT2 family glycosyltransferase
MDSVLSGTEAIRVPFPGEFNFSAMNNKGAAAASGEILLFLNDDVQPLAPDWLEWLAGHAQRPEIGAAGPQLLYPRGTVQHAGLALGIMDGAGHPFRGTFGSAYWPWLDCTRNVAAVTGACLAIRKSVFDHLGGFDSAFPRNYNDVDLCLRAREAGFEVVVEPASLLRHDECATRPPGVDFDERDLFFSRWGHWFEQGDPFYSVHLTATREDATLRD